GDGCSHLSVGFSALESSPAGISPIVGRPPRLSALPRILTCFGRIDRSQLNGFGVVGPTRATRQAGRMRRRRLRPRLRRAVRRRPSLKPRPLESWTGRRAFRGSKPLSWHVAQATADGFCPPVEVCASPAEAYTGRQIQGGSGPRARTLFAVPCYR